MPPIDSPPQGAAPDPPPPKNASLLQVAGAVFWSFLGVRKGSAMSRDIGTINPVHVIIVGNILAAIFVFTLIGIVTLITRAA